MCEKGIVIAFSGNGKGKTSAAIGSAIRMIGWKKKVVYCSFFKKKSSVELKVLKKFNNCEVLAFCEEYPSFSTNLSKKEFISFFKSEWNKFLKKIHSLKNCDLVVIDEILIAIRDGLLKDSEIISLIEEIRRNNTHIVLTGRGITEMITNYADIVTEMKCIKHPYPEVTAIKGIDW